MASLERGSGPSHQNRNRSIDVIDLTESDGEVAEDNGSDSDETLLGDDLQNFFSTSHLGNTSSRIVPSFSRAGRTFKAGKTAELTDGSFLFITAVMEDHSLSGYLLCRTRRLQGLLEYKRNEVVMLLRYDDTDPRDILQQSVEHVDITDIVKFRQLIRSNKSFPAFSFRETECRPKSGLSKAEIYQREAYIEAHCQLVCRWKFLQINKEYGFLQVLTKKDIDENHYVTPEDLKYNFCGDTVRQGACPGWRPGEEAFVQAERSKYRGVDLLNFNRGPTTSQDDAMDLTNDRRYTFADICCGGGGASRGAQAANLCVYLGLDNNIPAMNTYRLNFPFARFEGIGIHEFVTIVPECKVDIVHVSLPCQPFAHCHARPGQNDEMNQATFVSIEHLLKKLKPRLVIFEETSGLIRINNNKPWFRKTIQDFTRLGFSVRWKVMNFAEFGLPQERKRFILFASCPGEELPEFPKATHCKQSDHYRNPHLSPFTSINDAISHIPPGFPFHNVDTVMKRNNSPYDGNRPTRHTITCSGSLSTHPSGTRDFTVRELATMNGFPLKHTFAPSGTVTETKRQIGNAMPPLVEKHLCEHLVRCLLRADRL